MWWSSIIHSIVKIIAIHHIPNRKFSYDGKSSYDGVPPWWLSIISWTRDVLAPQVACRPVRVQTGGCKDVSWICTEDEICMFNIMGIRARWNKKMSENVSYRVYSNVKFNFKPGLFSWIFWFEVIFLGNRALLVFWPCCWENGSKMVKKMQFSKIGFKPTQKW